MPKIDPITGCEVMTFPEFLHAEAAREGVEPHEIMQEIVQTFEDDNALMRQQYRDPANVLTILQKDATELRKDWQSNKDDDPTFNDPQPPYPTEIIAVLDANYHQGFGGSSGGFTARVKCDDGKERYAVFCEFSDHGDRMTPPDGGAEVSYYDDPVLTENERALLNTVATTHIHRDHWWHVPRKGLEGKGCIAHRRSVIVPSTIGRIALGLPPVEEDE